MISAIPSWSSPSSTAAKPTADRCGEPSLPPQRRVAFSSYALRSILSTAEAKENPKPDLLQDHQQTNTGLHQARVCLHPLRRNAWLPSGHAHRRATRAIDDQIQRLMTSLRKSMRTGLRRGSQRASCNAARHAMRTRVCGGVLLGRFVQGKIRCCAAVVGRVRRTRPFFFSRCGPVFSTGSHIGTGGFPTAT